MSLKIITESSCDLSQEDAEKLGIIVIPLTTIIDGKEYLDGVTIDNKEFFEKLEKAEELPHTSQMTPGQYRKVFEEVKENGDQAICITLSSKLSGCNQNALLAREELEDVVEVIDSENACIGQRILVELAAKLRDEGKDFNEIVKILNEKKKKIRLLALVDTLEYLQKGGRVSTLTAFIGNALNVKPVIAIENGEVIVVGKARGSRKGNNLLRKMIEETQGIDFNAPYSLAYSGSDDSLLQKYIKDHRSLFEDQVEELPVCLIGSTIGTHAGPGAIAVAFFEK